MTIETNDKPGEWIATVTGQCAIHGVTESWGAYAGTALEASNKLDDTRASLTEGEHELTTWEPQVGRVFELPHRQELAAAYTPVDEATERSPVEDAATAVYAQIEDLTSHDRLLVLRMAISAEEGNVDHTDDLCQACAEPIAEGYESPNNDDANGIRFCANCTRLEDEEITAEQARDSEHKLTISARARAQIEVDLRRVNEQLRNQANGMAKDMTTLLEDLQTGVRINELGIVQGNGSIIDRLCAQRHTLIEIRRTLEGRP